MLIKTITENSKRIWFQINLTHRRQLKLLLILMFISSFVEVISFGSLLPFLKVIADPEFFLQNKKFQSFFEFVGVTNKERLLLLSSALFIGAVIISGVIRLILLRVTSLLSFNIGSDLSVNIYRRAMYQPYVIHCKRNSSEIIDGIITKSRSLVHYLIIPMLTMINVSLIVATVFIALFIFNPIATIFIFSTFGVIYLLISYFFGKRLVINSKIIAIKTSLLLRLLQEGFGGIRDVLIDNKEELYANVYQTHEALLSRSQADNLFISSSPRYFIEAISILLITFILLILNQQSGGIESFVTVIGIFIVFAQRLLPLFHQFYSSLANVMGGRASIETALEFLEHPTKRDLYPLRVKKINFDNTISLKNVNFRYSEKDPYILKYLNLQITKGSRVGFIGETGSGKSTLLDLIMALLEPTKGCLEVDGVKITPSNRSAWQANIAHVPQSIFLLDSTIEQNIAFGVPEDQIDHKRVIEVAEAAQIRLAIEKLPLKYKTNIGERGVLLSGGERQRIGIARALYKKTNLIILDEATSALDNKTEKAVMRAIDNLSSEITILIIAHRLTTLQGCTQIINLDAGKNIESIQYNVMLKKKNVI